MVSLSSPGVLVQITHLQWDKAVRGGDLATKRNAVAAAFPISPLSLDNLSGSLEVEMRMCGQNNDFAAPFRSWNGQYDLSKVFEWKCVRLEFEAPTLNIIWDGNKNETGKPLRPFAKTLALEADQWAQIRWNGRFVDVDSGVWWYEQTTFNIASCCSRPQRDLFLRSEPHAKIEQLSWLK